MASPLNREEAGVAVDDWEEIKPDFAMNRLSCSSGEYREIYGKAIKVS